MSEQNGAPPAAGRALRLVCGRAGAGRPAGKRPAARARPAGDGGLRAWAYAGVGLTLTLSAGLNGLAFADRAPAAWAGWALGAAVPALVLIFSRVSALSYARGRRALAYAGAGACLSILLLSVQHMAASIAALTGEHAVLAGIMALAVDAGLVVCELATVGRK